eukprot:TRINITY_DN333_c0_g1_i1.p1 TRINITY_DN333_c0_g1~~TRINITY_DN333_c0_g1_i1.p1  ORF type:complete len:133 (+),score=23.81 TRINITY_DN333_c0_g1_i1:492-890(+)
MQGLFGKYPILKDSTHLRDADWVEDGSTGLHQHKKEQQQTGREGAPCTSFARVSFPRPGCVHSALKKSSLSIPQRTRQEGGGLEFLPFMQFTHRDCRHARITRFDIIGTQFMSLEHQSTTLFFTTPTTWLKE